MFGNVWFILYRLAFIGLLFVFLLHWLISMQSLVYKAIFAERTPRRGISTYFIVTCVFFACLFLIEWNVWRTTMGPKDVTFLAGNKLQMILALALVVPTVLVMLIFKPPESPRKHDRQKEPLKADDVRLDASFAEVVGGIQSMKGMWAFLATYAPYTTVSFSFAVLPFLCFCVLMLLSPLRDTKKSQFGLNSESLYEYVHSLHDFAHMELAILGSDASYGETEKLKAGQSRFSRPFKTNHAIVGLDRWMRQQIVEEGKLSQSWDVLSVENVATRRDDAVRHIAKLKTWRTLQNSPVQVIRREPPPKKGADSSPSAYLEATE